MPLSAGELDVCRRLRQGHRILMYLAATSSPGWTTVPELAELVGVSTRRAGLVLAELVADGWLRQEVTGPSAPGRRVRYLTRTVIPQDHRSVIPQDHRTVIPQDHRTVIPQDHRTVIPQDHPEPVTHYRARGRARAGAPPDGSHSQALIRPSVLGGAGGDGRTDGRAGGPDVRGSDVQWVAERWEVTRTIAHANLCKLAALGLDRREAREYLTAAKRGAHPAFGGLQHAHYPLGAACTRERVELWRSSVRTRPVVLAEGTPVERRDALEHQRAAAAAAERVRAALAPADARAIGAEVGRLLREA